MMPAVNVKKDKPGPIIITFVYIGRDPNSSKAVRRPINSIVDGEELSGDVIIRSNDNNSIQITGLYAVPEQWSRLEERIQELSFVKPHSVTIDRDL